MVIAGVDYSLTSPAICVHHGAEWKYENCQFHFFRKKKQTDGGEFVGYDYPEWVNDQDRYEKLSAWSLDVMFFNDVSKAYIEGYAFGAVGRVFNIAENGGYLKQRLWLCGIPFEVPAPTVIKKFGSGKGNASKELMYESFIAETGVDIRARLDIMSPKNWNPISDIIDAYYIAKFGFFEEQKHNDTDL